MQWSVSLLGMVLVAKAVALFKFSSFSLPHLFSTVQKEMEILVVFSVLFGGIFPFVFKATLQRKILQKWISKIGFLFSFYIFINLPTMIELGTPLTRPILAAAGGALADSFLHSCSKELFVAILFTFAAGRLGFYFGKKKLVFLSCLGIQIFLLLGKFEESSIVTLNQNLFLGLIQKTSSSLSVESFSSLQEGYKEKSSFPSWNTKDWKSKNIILIGLESTGARYLGVHNSKLKNTSLDPTPFLTEISGHSWVFDQTYAVYPESIKGMFSVFCSIYPALGVDVLKYENRFNPCLSEVLKKEGYTTALFHSGLFDYLGMKEILRNRSFDILEDATHISKNKQRGFGLSDEQEATKRILEWIDLPERKKNPFFIWYLPAAGHHPYSSPKVLDRRFPMNNNFNTYQNALDHMDRVLRKFVEELRYRRLLKDTVLIFYGDHGEAFEQHPGNTAHSLYIYEENLHVPLLFYLEGVTHLGVRSSSLVSLVDLSPTILDLLGMSIPVHYQGIPLTRFQRTKLYFFTDYSIVWLGLRHLQWKGLFRPETQDFALYDLRQDPEEKQDISKNKKEYLEMGEKMKKEMREWVEKNKLLFHDRFSLLY